MWGGSAGEHTPVPQEPRHSHQNCGASNIKLPFLDAATGKGERMLMLKLLGGGKICFQVAAYYKNCWQKANFCLDWNAWVPSVVLMIPAA